MIRIKRAYERPASGDGRRVLVERLWPRGLKKEALAADAWRKEVAPTTELRRWFGHRTERWEEFRRRYRAELDGNPDGWAPLLTAARAGALTLLYSARDTSHNSAAVLRDYLEERRAGRRPRRARTARATPARTPRPPRPRSRPRPRGTRGSGARARGPA